jgi:hypothetical protein
VYETDSSSSVVPFVEIPELPVNQLAGRSLDRADGLVIVTTHEIIDVGGDRVEPITGLPDHGDQTAASVIEAASQAVVSVACPGCASLLGPRSTSSGTGRPDRRSPTAGEPLGSMGSG